MTKTDLNRQAMKTDTKKEAFSHTPLVIQRSLETVLQEICVKTNGGCIIATLMEWAPVIDHNSWSNLNVSRWKRMSGIHFVSLSEILSHSLIIFFLHTLGFWGFATSNNTPLSAFPLLILLSPPCQTGAFKRNFSSPLLTLDPLGVVREAPAAQGEWWPHRLIHHSFKLDSLDD